MTAPTFRDLVASEKPLYLPGAHDALSARLIERAGFKAYMIGGFPLVGARYAIPDVGLVGLGEMSSAIRDIIDACDLPVFVDGDNGYGDVKTVVKTVETYERMGAQAIQIEDQISPKRCGHMAGKEVIPIERAVAHIKAAKDSSDLWILGRTDARQKYGLDEALRRAEAYIKAGADGIFVEAPTSIPELERIGAAFDVPQLANMLEGGRTPILKPNDLYELGFTIVAFGISLLMRTTKVMQDALADMKSGELALFGTGVGFDEYQELVGFNRWAEVEARFAPSESN
jgi:2-methylisocitrate lyase-like PEP mutase family enzyme